MDGGTCQQVVAARQEQRYGGHAVAAEAETDAEGAAVLMVPFFVPLVLQVHHELLMEPQERQLVANEPYTSLAFVAETVVQIWQVEKAKELIIYCSSPRVARSLHGCAGFLPFPTLQDQGGEPRHGYIPFQGQLQFESGDVLQANAQGCIRWSRDPLLEAELVTLPGWCSAHISREAARNYATGRLVEVCRLAVPVVQVQLTARCCGAPIPDVQIYMDGERCGGSGVLGSCVPCGVKCGDHSAQAMHPLVLPDGISAPLRIDSAATVGVQLEFPLERLHFVCVSRPGACSDVGSTAELYLVGGDLAQWRCSQNAPGLDAEVWLWDGQLCGVAGEPPIEVKAGVVDWDRNGQSSWVTPSEVCSFAKSLSLPISSHGPWQVTLHPLGKQGECTVVQLACLALSATPALWLGQLSVLPVARSVSPVACAVPCPRVSVQMRCCSHGYRGLPIAVDGVRAGETDATGLFVLEAPGPEVNSCRIGLEGVPPCVLPGWSTEFLMHINRSAKCTQVNLQVSCMLWVFYTLPEEEDEEYSIQKSMQKGMVWVCADSKQVPDEALPLRGLLDFNTPESILQLDGQSLGPFMVNLKQETDGRCSISALRFVPEPVPGFLYEPRAPSPLRERQLDIGGCKLQRLCGCPMVIGHLVPVGSVVMPGAEADGDPYADAGAMEFQSATRWEDLPRSPNTSRTSSRLGNRPGAPQPRCASRLDDLGGDDGDGDGGGAAFPGPERPGGWGADVGGQEDQRPSPAQGSPSGRSPGRAGAGRAESGDEAYSEEAYDEDDDEWAEDEDISPEDLRHDRGAPTPRTGSPTSDTASPTHRAASSHAGAASGEGGQRCASRLDGGSGAGGRASSGEERQALGVAEARRRDGEAAAQAERERLVAEEAAAQSAEQEEQRRAEEAARAAAEEQRRAEEVMASEGEEDAVRGLLDGVFPQLSEITSDAGVPAGHEQPHKAEFEAEAQVGVEEQRPKEDAQEAGGKAHAEDDHYDEAEEAQEEEEKAYSEDEDCDSVSPSDAPGGPSPSRGRGSSRSPRSGRSRSRAGSSRSRSQPRGQSRSRSRSRSTSRSRLSSGSRAEGEGDVD